MAESAIVSTKYDMKCANGHTFESWFNNSEKCDELLAKNMVECPECGNVNISKAIMAPNINTSKSTPPPTDAAIQKVVDDIEYVGDRFAEEARQMHYGEKVEKNIVGIATVDEQKELKEEGVDFFEVKPKKPN